MKNIFLSYSRGNLKSVKTIVEDLISVGHKVWFDQKLHGGQDWWDEILSEIRKSDIVIVIVSEESLCSFSCESEWEYADVVNKYILPVLVEDVSTNRFPPILSRIQHVDYRNRDADAILKLVGALENLSSPKPLPSPLPKPPEVPIGLSRLRGKFQEITNNAHLEQQRAFEQQQYAFLSECKKYIKEKFRFKEEILEAHKLIKEFREQDYLYAKVLNEIDELLKPFSESKSPDKNTLDNTNMKKYDFPYFSEEEFNSQSKNLANLCDAIIRDKYDILKSLELFPYTIHWLNEILTIPNFYDILCERKTDKQYSKEIKKRVKWTRKHRDKKYSDLSKNERGYVKELNRLLLEETYPDLTPKLKPGKK